jgi:hypothetical protein
MSDVLTISLQVAVPLRIAEVASWSWDRRQREAGEVANVVASHGDDLLYGGKHCADAFNKLALGLACLAYAPGGVTFMGEHFEAPDAPTIDDQPNPAGGNA